MQTMQPTAVLRRSCKTYFQSMQIKQHPAIKGLKCHIYIFFMQTTQPTAVLGLNCNTHFHANHAAHSRVKTNR